VLHQWWCNTAGVLVELAVFAVVHVALNNHLNVALTYLLPGSKVVFGLPYYVQHELLVSETNCWVHGGAVVGN
jgi:hypothetical protein